jgi:hypothetical protein
VSHVVFVDFWLGESQANHFLEGGQLLIEVEGSLDHVGSLGKRTPQPFRGILYASKNPNATYFEEETAQDQQRQSK